MPINTPTTAKSDLKRHVMWVAYLVGVLTLIEALNMLTGRMFNQYSIYPRDLDFLAFIFTAPFLHANFGHFASNVITLAIFAVLLLQFGASRFIQVSVGLVILTGLLVWGLGRPAYHLGASGVIYGYFGYLVLAGFLSKRLSLMAISVAVAFFYGGMIWGVLPSQPYISWESHLFGFVAGLFLAYIFRTKRSVIS
ncbi:rhomboid family intramembrane serine protease [Glaciecola sp. MH2013]|uniref:rhomboid family intramembrane serine protease n=1 Tax=Glaciecola sp. MH2013 TaxID=2785524 RepID=UPI00189FF139|nr:rhomboid family intramembrane serine protease [Glaciecola sp. MH2013]